MRRLLRQSSRVHGNRAVDEAFHESSFEQGETELQGRQQFKRIFKLVLLLVVTYPLYLWWKIEPQIPNTTLVFPLHARFFFNNGVENVSQAQQRLAPLSPRFKILEWHHLAHPETYYRGVHPLYNIAFFVEICVGGKTYFMLIDTGSEVSWLFCEPPFVISKDNPKFAGPNGRYQPSFDNLILYKDLHPSGFYACYQDRYLCRNIYYIGGLVVNVLMVKETFVMRHIDMSTTSGKLVFGCGHSCKGPIDDIKDGVDGVLGLMPKLFSLPCQLASTGAIRKVIGLCLKKYSHNHLQQQMVGYLSFGDGVILVPEKMTWINMIDDATTFGFAAAFLKSIEIGTFNHTFGQECQGKQNAKIVFDTGTTMTYLMPDVYDGLVQYVLFGLPLVQIGPTQYSPNSTNTCNDLQAVCMLDKHAVHVGYEPLSEDSLQGDMVKRLTKNYKMCWYRDLSDMNFMWYKDFENLTFKFYSIDGNEFAQYQIEPSQYLSVYKVDDIDSKIGIICSLFLKHETKDSQPFNILGGMAFQGHLVVFDIENKKIGWSTPKDCELAKLQSKIKNLRTSH